jgi:hypothetical protein
MWVKKPHIAKVLKILICRSDWLIARNPEIAIQILKIETFERYLTLQLGSSAQKSVRNQFSLHPKAGTLCTFRTANFGK